MAFFTDWNWSFSPDSKWLISPDANNILHTYFRKHLRDMHNKHINKVAEEAGHTRLSTISQSKVRTIFEEAIPLVRNKYSSKEYIEFLKLLDAKYPKTDKIRLALDNLKVHSSEETRKYLATVPKRFEFVFTPKHGSWLNLIEGFFSKLTRQMLKGICVKLKKNLCYVYKYFDEINEDPVIHHWKYKLEEINSSEEIVIDTLPIKCPVN